MNKNPNAVGPLVRQRIDRNTACGCSVPGCVWPRYVQSVYCRSHFSAFVRNHSPTHARPRRAVLAIYRRAAVSVLADCDTEKLHPSLTRNIELMRNWLYGLLRAGRIHRNPREIRRWEYQKKLTHYLGLLWRDGVSQDDLLVSLGALYGFNLADPHFFDPAEKGRQFRRCLGETFVKTSPRQFQIRVNSPPGSYNHQLQLSEAVGVFDYVGEMLLQALGFGLLQFGKAIGEQAFPGQEWSNPALNRIATQKPAFVAPPTVP